ncbi:hypothetical protein ACWDA7_09525 [Streptomyces sp. NPDC001156]
MGTIRRSADDSQASARPNHRNLMNRPTDLSSLEAAAALLVLVRAVLDSETEPTADELAVFLRPVTDALEDVLSVATRRA